MKILLVRYMLTFILIFQSNENYSFVTSVMYLNIQAVILCYTFVCVCVCVCFIDISQRTLKKTSLFN